MIDVVILVGGFGSRLKPLTDNMPKPLIPVNGKPLLRYIVDRLPLSKVNSITFAAGYKAELMQAYGEELSAELDLPVRTVVEDTPLLSGGAIRLAIEGTDPDLPVLISNGDIVTTIDGYEILERWVKERPDVLLSAVFQEDASRFGTILSDDNDNVLEFKEKVPLTSNQFINSGLWITTKQLIIGNIGLGERMSYERDLIPRVIASGRSVKVIRFADVYFNDIADIGELAKTEDYLLHWANGR